VVARAARPGATWADLERACASGAASPTRPSLRAARRIGVSLDEGDLSADATDSLGPMEVCSLIVHASGAVADTAEVSALVVIDEETRLIWTGTIGEG
jgi:hypothetical protein